MKTLLLLLALIVAPLSVQAAEGDYHLVMHTSSYHTVPRTKGPAYNQVNPGIAIRYELSEDTAIQGGVYKNSFYKTSYYAGYEWMPLHVGPVSAGVFGGAVTGYVMDVMPMAGGVVRWTQGKADFTVRIMPAKCSVITFELGWRF